MSRRSHCGRISFHCHPHSNGRELLLWSLTYLHVGNLLQIWLGNAVNHATSHATCIPRRYKGAWLLEVIGREFWFDYCLFHSLIYNDLHGLLTDSLIWSSHERLIRRYCYFSLTFLHVGNLLQIWLGNASIPRRYKSTCLLDVIGGEFWFDFCLFQSLTNWFTRFTNWYIDLIWTGTINTTGAATLLFLVYGLWPTTSTTTNQPIS